MSPPSLIEEIEPPRSDPEYAVTVGRAPLQPLVQLPPDWFQHMRGPVFGQIKVRPFDNDLTVQGAAEPIGSRVVIFGRVTDHDGRPVRHSLVEIWQANAAGGYIDVLDPCGFALDPNFKGCGRCLTDQDGNYRFTTIRPGAYPARYSSTNLGWRAAHIHFSVFGESFHSRLVTQMYFEGDPLLRQDRMLLAIPDVRGQDRLIAKFCAEQTLTQSMGPGRHHPTLDGSGIWIQPPQRDDEFVHQARNPSALAYRFDIVLRGDRATPFEGTA
jgi:protocatechuate 3,4-dioxygenase, beta subunit